MRKIKNFVIVGTQRTGSSALAEAIGLHPDIACGWEWTQYNTPRWKKLTNAQRALNGDFSRLLPGHRKYITKVFNPNKTWLGYRRLFGANNKWIVHPRFSPSLWWDRLEDHITWFQNQNDIHIIHIVRHNEIDWLKSKFIARKAKSFRGKSYPEGIKVKIPINEAILRLRAKDWIDTRLSTLIDSNPYLQLSYEDLFEDIDSVAAKAVEFLDCDSSLLKSVERHTKKQSKGSPTDYILNYDALAAKITTRKKA